MHENFEPKIIGFLCTWCSYAGADLCGVSRYQYPPSIRIIRVMCSGRVPVHVILSAFKLGADGVLVAGCHPGDCHYLHGNYYTERRIRATQKLLGFAGIEPARLRLEWISASEGERFSKVVSSFTDEIRDIGPNPLKTDERRKICIQAAIDASKGFRLKALVGKEIKLTEIGNVYGVRKEKEEMDALVEAVAQAEYHRFLILQLCREISRSVLELASMISLRADKVLEHVTALRGSNLIGVDRIEGSTPFYKSLLGGE
jgi:coenzyme F420-reducing hydrogenase delta subunit